MRRPDEIPLTAAARKLGVHRQLVWRWWKNGWIEGRRESPRRVYLLTASIKRFQEKMSAS